MALVDREGKNPHPHGDIMSHLAPRFAITVASRTRMTLALQLWLLVSACDHSPTYPATHDGAVGPFRTINGVAQLTTGGAYLASWTADGRGILGVISSWVPGPPRCLGILPGQGGSAIWGQCPVWPRNQYDADSAFGQFTPAIGPSHRILYLSGIGPEPGKHYPFPVGWHIELFVFDTSQAFTSRRAIATLYHDHVGISAFGPNEVSWLDRILWVGQDSFVALGENYNPNGTITPLHVVLGVIGTSSAAFTAIAGTDRARLLSLAEEGKTLVLVRDSLTVERVPLTGGTSRVVVTLPASAQRSLLDLSCQGTMCLLLTQEPGGASLWTVTTTGADLKMVRSFTGQSPTTAQLSPSSGDVLMQIDRQLYLIAGLVPH